MVKHRDTVEASAQYTGYLTCLELPIAPGSLLGFLFIVNQVDEPVEFTYAMAEAPTSASFWSADSVYRHAVRKMSALLLEKAVLTPGLILTIDVSHSESGGRSGIPSGIFGKEIEIEVPVVRLVPGVTAGEIDQAVDVPLNDQATKILSDRMERGRILDPFQTGKRGISEIFERAQKDPAGK